MESKRSLIHEDPRVPLAAERTFLAWIRTGLALMGFGFVVARFGLFLREMEAAQHIERHSGYGVSLWLGIALVVLGGVPESGGAGAISPLSSATRSGNPA
jgi:putative membrane protein